MCSENILRYIISHFRYEVCGLFHKRFFHYNSNWSEILLCFHPSFSRVIALIFCILHDSCATGRAEFCMLFQWSYIKSNFPSDLNYDKKNCSWNGPQHNKRFQNQAYPDSKIHGTNMGPTWIMSAPDGPHLGPMNLAIRVANEISWKMCNLVVSMSLLFCWHGDDRVLVPHIYRTDNQMWNIRGPFANMA